MTEVKRNNIAVVTGGVKRIGAEIVLRLLEKNYHVVVHHRSGDREQLIRSAAESATAVSAEEIVDHTTLIHGDLRDPACLDHIAACAAQLGNWQILINTAAQFLPDRPANFSAESMLSHWQVNLLAPVCLTQALYHHQTEAGWVVNLLDNKLWKLDSGFFSYTLAKSALHTATQTMALGFGSRLSIFGLALGLTLPSAFQTPERFQQAHIATASRRGVTVEDVGSALELLLSGCLVNGQTLVVDHGARLIPPDE